VLYVTPLLHKLTNFWTCPLQLQYALRKKVLRGDLTKFSCFRKFFVTTTLSGVQVIAHFNMS
jgi:hypothetical protein